MMQPERKSNPVEITIPRKWALKTQGRQVVFASNPDESSRHVLMKALLWALYLPQYPAISVEVNIGDRYKPDLVALNDVGEPVFWGEAGQVGVEKIHSLCRRYPQTHFAIAKWAQRVEPVADVVQAADPRRRRTAPFDLLTFPPDSLTRFFDSDGQVRITFEDIHWLRVE